MNPLQFLILCIAILLSYKLGQINLIDSMMNSSTDLYAQVYGVEVADAR